MVRVAFKQFPYTDLLRERCPRVCQTRVSECLNCAANQNHIGDNVWMGPWRPRNAQWLSWKERLSLKSKVQWGSVEQSGQGVEGIGKRVPRYSLGELVTGVRMGPVDPNEAHREDSGLLEGLDLA